MSITGAFSRAIQRVFTKRFGGPLESASIVPPQMSTGDYVKAYGEIGWLYSCVSRRAGAVASAVLHLYRLDGEQNQTELFDHPLLTLLGRPNPYTTQYKFMTLTQTYMDLTGEAFWVVERDRVGRPFELWLVNPAYMFVVPDKTSFIKGWVYQSGGQRIPIEAQDVVHLFFPDPANPYRASARRRQRASTCNLLSTPSNGTATSFPTPLARTRSSSLTARSARTNMSLLSSTGGRAMAA